MNAKKCNAQVHPGTPAARGCANKARFWFQFSDGADWHPRCGKHTTPFGNALPITDALPDAVGLREQ